MHGLRLTWVWHDVDVIQLRGVVETARFRGEGEGYFGYDEGARLAAELARFVKGSQERVAYSSGTNTSAGIHFELFTRTSARHVYIHLKLMTQGDHEHVDGVEVTTRVAIAAVERFSRELEQLKKLGDEAFLELH